MIDTLINRMTKLAQEQPDQLAVAFKSEQLTYAQLLDKIKWIGNRLSELGVGRGDRVLFTAFSKPEMVAAYLGIQYCGAVAVFLDKNATVENMEFASPGYCPSLHLSAPMLVSKYFYRIHFHAKQR